MRLYIGISFVVFIICRLGERVNRDIKTLVYEFIGSLLWPIVILDIFIAINYSLMSTNRGMMGLN